MLNKIKRVVIKDPFLIRLRDNLRLIWIRWFYDLEAGLEVLWHAAEGAEKALLRRELEGLRRSIYKSICRCNTCGKTGKNHLYLPFTKAWVCFDCLDNNLVYGYNSNGDYGYFNKT